MKIRTKFLAAVLATAMAFSCALTASAWDKDTAPAVEFGNSAMPGIQKGDTATATLTLKSSDFVDVTGAKLTVELPAEMTLVDASVTGNGSWVEGTDYKVDKDAGTITLVNVFNIGDAAKNLSVYLGLTVSGTFNGAITVSGEFADTNVDKVYTYDGFATGTLTLSRSEAIHSNEEDAKAAIAEIANTDYFVPVGGVYTVGNNGEVKYYSKADNQDTFDFTDATGDITVLKCPLPADGEDVTTFGYTIKDGDKNSEKEYERYNGIQFGAYTNKKTGKEFGTLIIMGDYTAFKNCYPDETDEELLKRIVARYDTRVGESIIDAGDPLTLKTGDHSITVKKVKQTAHMWEDENNLQYAVRLYKLVKDRSYTGVAYSYSDSEYNFSKEIQTKVNPYALEDF